MEIYGIRSAANRKLYSCVVKPVCFRCDPEKTHNFFLGVGRIFQRSNLLRFGIRRFFHYGNPALEQKLEGIAFSNPVGLSAGFDKNAEIISVIGDVGFGFTEVGSITANPCSGNKGKRLARLPEKKSLWVNFGLNNSGADRISARLNRQIFDIPVGISVAKTNCKETVKPRAAVNDYLYSLRKFEESGVGDYFTINISCPNAYGGQTFSDPRLFENLMKSVVKLNIRRPIFVKLSPDLDRRTIDSLVKISGKYGISGFVCTNLTKKDTGFDKGGLSGKAVSGKSDALLSQVYGETRSWKRSPVIIGVGGIFSAGDAYRKIKLGANLVQLITGMIYVGPSLVGDINKGLVDLLEKDGFSKISEAIGIEHSKNQKGGKI